MATCYDCARFAHGWGYGCDGWIPDLFHGKGARFEMEKYCDRFIPKSKT